MLTYTFQVDLLSYQSKKQEGRKATDSKTSTKSLYRLLKENSSKDIIKPDIGAEKKLNGKKK
jgi:hypothetical protein